MGSFVRDKNEKVKQVFQILGSDHTEEDFINTFKRLYPEDWQKIQEVMYDYLIVGSGLYGAVMAQQLHAAGKKVLVIDKRPNIAGNVYTENVEGIHVHKYGAHIFHTNDKKVWDYLQAFTVFNRFTNSPVANYKGTVGYAKLPGECGGELYRPGDALD